MVKRELSCGGVLYDKVGGYIQIILVKRLRKSGLAVWCIPKGKIEKGETYRDTALREVREETGMHGIIKDELGKVGYWFYDTDNKVKINKIVRFFLMEYKEGNLKDHDTEVEEARWVSLDEALNLMSYNSEKEIVKKAKDMLLKEEDY